MLSVGVDREGAAGAQLQAGRPEDPHLVLLDVGALEHLGQVTHEAQLADLADDDDVEFGVVQLRIRRDEHPAPESPAVGDRDRVAAEANPLRADPDREAGGLPAQQRAQCGICIDEIAAQEVGLVRDSIRFRVEADAGNAEEPLAVGLADVDLTALSRGDDRHRLLWVLGDTEYTGEVVTATAGNDPERRFGAGQGTAYRAHQTIAAHHHGDLTRLDGAKGLFDAVLEAFGALHAEGEASSVESLLGPWQQLQGLPSCRGRIDQQRQWHALDVHRAQPKCAPGSAGVAESRDNKSFALLAGDLLEPLSLEAAGQSPLAEALQSAAGARQKHDQLAAGAQNAPQLLWTQPAPALDDEIEEVIRIGEGGGRAGLEGNPALGIEANPGHRSADHPLGAVQPPHSRRRELTGQEQRPVTFAAADLEHPLGPAIDPEHRGGKGDERVGGHAAIIATAQSRHHLGFAPMEEAPDRRWIVLAGFAVIAVAVVIVILVARGGGDGDDDESATTASAEGCRSVEAPDPKDVSYKAPPQTVKKGEQLTAVVETSCGTFDIALDSERAPKTVNSFVFLSEKGFYDGLDFHRAVPAFVIQGGDPQGNGTGGPGYKVVEKPPANLAYTKGVVAMAKSSAEPSGTSGSQFFVVIPPDAGLPPEYALVGKVDEGMDVVERIGKLGGPEEKPKQTVLIEKITIEKG